MSQIFVVSDAFEAQGRAEFMAAWEMITPGSPALARAIVPILPIHGATYNHRTVEDGASNRLHLINIAAHAADTNKRADLLDAHNGILLASGLAVPGPASPNPITLPGDIRIVVHGVAAWLDQDRATGVRWHSGNPFVRTMGVKSHVNWQSDMTQFLSGAIDWPPIWTEVDGLSELWH